MEVVVVAVVKEVMGVNRSHPTKWQASQRTLRNIWLRWEWTRLHLTYHRKTWTWIRTRCSNQMRKFCLHWRHQLTAIWLVCLMTWQHLTVWSIHRQSWLTVLLLLLLLVNNDSHVVSLKIFSRKSMKKLTKVGVQPARSLLAWALVREVVVKVWWVLTPLTIMKRLCHLSGHPRVGYPSTTRELLLLLWRMIDIKTLVRTKQHRCSRTLLEKTMVVARDRLAGASELMVVARSAVRGNPSLKSTMAQLTTALGAAAVLTTLAV